MIFAIKMLLDNTYGLLNLFEFKINHFNSLVQAKSEFKNSNFGGKYIEIHGVRLISWVNHRRAKWEMHLEKNQISPRKVHIIAQILVES